jgi:hypothetical protein
MTLDIDRNPPASIPLIIRGVWTPCPAMAAEWCDLKAGEVVPDGVYERLSSAAIAAAFAALQMSVILGRK